MLKIPELVELLKHVPNIAPVQEKYLSAVIEHKTVANAAAALGVAEDGIYHAIHAVRAKAPPSQNGPSPRPLKCLIIPDMQIKPNIDLLFVHCIGQHILAKRPDVIVNIGDMADMESLSSYDKGKRSFEGRRYKNDIESVITAQKILWKPVEDYNAAHPTKQYKPRRVFLMGNHEDRGNRVTQLDPMLFGTINIEDDLKLSQYWNEVYPFKRVVIINGVAFCHYFPPSIKDTGMGCSSPMQQLRIVHMSAIAGHKPGRQTYTERAGDGKLLTSIIAGSSYDYDLEYMGPQGNIHWRGIIMLHNMINGEFDEVYIPIEYLKNKYGKGMGPMVFAPEDKK